MNKTLLSLFVLTAVAMTGCSTVSVVPASDLSKVQLAPSGTTLAHLNADSWGLYFFCWPVLTGSTNNPGNIVFMEDTVNIPCVTKMMTAKSKALGATQTLEVTSEYSGIDFIFWIRSVEMSGAAVR